MTADTEALRAQFEREFGKSPYEWNLSRFPEKSAWAGQYTELKTQCGWEAYQAGHAAASWTQATEHETPRAAIDAAKGESNGTVRAERSGFDTLPDDYKTGDY